METLVFTARWSRRQDDEAMKALQTQLMENPAAGDAIPGCGILRKLRFGDPSRGKGRRGGLRVIYMYTPQAARIDLITVYGKGEQDDMSSDELAVLCGLAKAIRADLSRNTSRTPEDER